MASVDLSLFEEVQELPSTPRFGVDFGGVICRSEGQDTASFFGANYLDVPASPGAFAAVAALVSFCGKENVFIVSKAGSKISARSLEWLDKFEFFEQTGMERKNVHFCRERPQKGDIARELQLTHFVDDAIENLQHVSRVKSMVSVFLFDPEMKAGVAGHIRKMGPRNNVTGKQVHSWHALMTHFLPSSLDIRAQLLETIPAVGIASASTPKQQKAKAGRVCRHFREGRCNRGDACRFSHSQGASSSS